MDSRRHFQKMLPTLVLLVSCSLAPSVGLAAIDAWPLLEVDEDTTTVAYPLFVKDHDFLMVFPLYYRTHQGRDHHVLWPLLKISEGKVERAAPFYFRAHDDQFTLFPLIHQTRDSTWWMVPPVYLSRSSDFHAVFPLYAHDEKTTWLLPNLRLDRDPKGRLERVRGYGVFDWRRGEEQQELDALLLASFAWGGAQTHAQVFPLFSFTRAPDYQSRWIGPWYASTTPSSRSGGILGLYGSSERVLGNGNRVEGLSLLAFTYGRRVERNPAGEIVSRSRRFVIFTDRQTGDRRSFGLLGLPIWETSTSGESQPRRPAARSILP